MAKRILAVVPLFLCLTTAPLLADQVLYCVDKNAVGITWDTSGVASEKNFKLGRYMVKLEPATEYGLKQVRFISQGAAGGGTKYECFNNLLGSLKGNSEIPDAALSPMACHDGAGTEPWMFFPDNTYTHSFLPGGPPSSGRDPNIIIAYGVCTAFQ